MSTPGSYHCLDAFIEQHQVGYDDDGILPARQRDHDRRSLLA
jgi:hypothetical protein